MKKYLQTINQLCILVPGLLVCSAASLIQPRDQLLIIPFGTKNKIVYHLKKGTYSIFFDSKASITNAGFLTDGMTESDEKSSSYQSYSKRAFKDSIGQGSKYAIIRTTSSGSKIKQVFYVYKHKEYFLVQLKVIGAKAASHYLSPLYSGQLSLRKEGDNRALFVPFDNDMWVRYNAAKSDSTDFTSSEVTGVYNSGNYNGIVIGSLEHEVWKTGIKLKSDNDQRLNINVFGGYTDSLITHDKHPHGMVLKDDSVSASPRIMIGYFDDWRIGMEIYGKNNRLMEPPVIFDWTLPTPMGWNSWGVLQKRLSLKKAKGVIDFLADSCQDFRTRDHSLFIDLDSFWDNMIHGGLRGDVDSLRQFVAYCNTHGFKPGIYWAPFTDWGKTARKVEGSGYDYPSCWTRANGEVMDIDGGRAMDPTHPATKARIKYYIEAFRKLGFKMIKVDFLAHATLEADSYYDKKVHTGMEAFKEGMEYLDKQIGHSMLVYAAISPNMATARYVHIRRIACDAFKNISETAYTLNSTTYGWWLGQMYNYLDADHVVFDDMPDGENRARLAAAVVTGTLITGDDYASPGKWRRTARKLLQNKMLLAIIQHDGKPFLPVQCNTGKNAGNLFVKQIGNDLYVAAFNYQTEPATIHLPPVIINGHVLQLANEAYDILNGTQGKEPASGNWMIPPKDAVIYKYRIK